MAFATPEALVYQIRRKHRRQEVEEVIHADYKGVMSCDRGKSYDALPQVKQQNCLAQLLRSLQAGIETDPENRFRGTLKTELESAHALWRAYRDGTVDRERYDRDGADLSKQVTLLLIREGVAPFPSLGRPLPTL